MIDRETSAVVTISRGKAGCLRSSQSVRPAGRIGFPFGEADLNERTVIVDQTLILAFGLTDDGKHTNVLSCVDGTLSAARLASVLYSLRESLDKLDGNGDLVDKGALAYRLRRGHEIGEEAKVQ